ncbi:MAG: YIP1 family protein [Candidatus Micrarchaeota archaeon]
MSQITDSEGYKSLLVLFGQYKKFAFDKISLIPYSSVPVWIAFSDGKVEEALKEKRGIRQSLKDTYALYVLGLFFSILAFWYIALFLGGIMLSAGALVTALGLLLNPVLTLAVIAGILVAALLLPGIFLLLRGAYYHIVMKVFGGKGSYSETVSVLVLTSGAHLVLMVPLYIAYAIIIGFILGPLAYAVIIYSLYLEYRGMKLVHGMTSKNAAIATAGAVLLEIGIYVGLYFAFYIGIMAFSLMH